jgi:hypothetical protein
MKSIVPTEQHSWKVRERVILVMKTIMMQNPDIRSRSAFALRIDTTAAAVSRWENRVGFPTTDDLVEICTVFAISPLFLFMGVGTMYGDLEVFKRLEDLEKRVGSLENKAGIKREK